jgi:O-antigen ligase
MSLHKLQLKIPDKALFWGFGSLVIGSLAYAILKDNIFALAIPFALLFVLLVLTNYQILYYLLIFSLPFSMQIPVVPGLNLDFPSEPLMAALMVCFGASMLAGAKPDKRFFNHPIIILIGLMYLWAMVLTLFSVDTTKTIKYLLAKAWYIVPFLLLTGSLVRSVKDIRRILWFFLVPLTGLTIMVFFKHMVRHFAFDAIQRAVEPFFKNHVIFAAVVALFIPYVLTLLRIEKKSLRPLLLFILAVLFIGVGISYTRASWLSLPLAGFYFLALKFRLTKISVIGAFVASFLAMGYFGYQNKFMLYAPDYEKTIFNRDNFEKHMEATYKLEDVSGMERVYRWVAALHMAYDRPIQGSGPSTFYPEYKKYTVKSFRTYVSDNPEHSTTHNYFLLQLAEQGLIGLLLFMALVAYLLILTEKLYHRTRNKEYRAIILGAGLCLFIIIFHLTLNELIEVDKIGSFYYISIAFLIKLDLWTREEKDKEAVSLEN